MRNIYISLTLAAIHVFLVPLIVVGTVYLLLNSSCTESNDGLSCFLFSIFSVVITAPLALIGASILTGVIFLRKKVPQAKKIALGGFLLTLISTILLIKFGSFVGGIFAPLISYIFYQSLYIYYSMKERTKDAQSYPSRL